MLEIWIDGRRIELKPIYDKGKIGQTVIFGVPVDWGDDPNPEEAPLSQYPYPSVFTIVNKLEGKGGYYVLKDSKGNTFNLKDKYYGASTSYLFDADQWIKFKDFCAHEKLSRKQRKIEKLEGQIDMLKDILIKQGIKVISEKEAKELGIE